MQNQISRRRLAVSLALAPVAGLPAVAITKARECDPIVAACAELEKLRIDREIADKKSDDAFEMYNKLRPERCYMRIIGGETFYDLADFDDSFYAQYLHEPTCEWLRKAREELVEIDAAKKRADQQSGHSEAEKALDVACDRVYDLEAKILAMVPTSLAGAAALLRVSRAPLEGDYAVELALAAIERVACFSERLEAA